MPLISECAKTVERERGRERGWLVESERANRCAVQPQAVAGGGVVVVRFVVAGGCGVRVSRPPNELEVMFIAEKKRGRRRSERGALREIQ